MTKKQTIQDYADRIGRVSSYIADHLDDDLDMYKLAEIACFSPGHWHRIYHAMTGETAAQTVRRLRLHRAAGELITSKRHIKAIAARAGYGSVEAFTRAFAAAYANPPARYRNHIEETDMYNIDDVSIESRPALKLATISHTGPYMEIGKAFEQLYIWASGHGLIGPDSRSIGVYLDDPAATPPAELRSEAGLIVPDDFSSDNPAISSRTLAAGPYAILRHKGPYAELEKAYSWLYGTWLPQSGREAADAPPCEEYLNNPQQVPASELLTDICLPLK